MKHHSLGRTTIKKNKQVPTALGTNQLNRNIRSVTSPETRVVHSLFPSPSEGTNPVALPPRNTPGSRIQQQLRSRLYFNSVETPPTQEKGDSRSLIGRGPRLREAQMYGRSLS